LLPFRFELLAVCHATVSVFFFTFNVVENS